MQNATEETIKEVTYWWPRPGTEKPLEKTAFYTRGRRVVRYSSKSSKDDGTNSSMRTPVGRSAIVSWVQMHCKKDAHRGERPRERVS